MQNGIFERGDRVKILEGSNFSSLRGRHATVITAVKSDVMTLSVDNEPLSACYNKWSLHSKELRFIGVDKDYKDINVKSGDKVKYIGIKKECGLKTGKIYEVVCVCIGNLGNYISVKGKGELKNDKTFICPGENMYKFKKLNNNKNIMKIIINEKRIIKGITYCLISMTGIVLLLSLIVFLCIFSI